MLHSNAFKIEPSIFLGPVRVRGDFACLEPSGAIWITTTAPDTSPDTSKWRHMQRCRDTSSHLEQSVKSGGQKAAGSGRHRLAQIFCQFARAKSDKNKNHEK